MSSALAVLRLRDSGPAGAGGREGSGCRAGMLGGCSWSRLTRRRARTLQPRCGREMAALPSEKLWLPVLASPGVEELSGPRRAPRGGSAFPPAPSSKRGYRCQWGPRAQHQPPLACSHHSAALFPRPAGCRGPGAVHPRGRALLAGLLQARPLRQRRLLSWQRGRRRQSRGRRRQSLGRDTPRR